MTVGVRELTRDAVRFQLAQAFYEVFLAQGYAETTVEDAARAVGISRATFFRYFSTKDEAVIAAIHKADLGAHVRALEIDQGDSPWQIARRAFDPSVAGAEANPTRVLAQVRMVNSVTSLKAQLSQRRNEQEVDFAQALTQVLGDSLTARVVAAASLAAVDVAWREWAENPETPFRDLVDAVFARLSA